MELLVRGNTSGHSWQLLLNVTLIETSVLVLVQTSTGLTKYLPSLEIITSVTLVIVVLDGLIQLSTPMMGCGANDACCEFNNPPWFDRCTTLPQATTNDMELRPCHDQGEDSEDTLIRLIDIYLM